MKQNEIKVESINIGLAGPNRIRKWAERILPNGKKIGQLTNSQTVNYKTLKPEIGGLFCERILGPIKSGICACSSLSSALFTLSKMLPKISLFQIFRCFT